MLSALGQLNRGGYALFFLLAAGTAVWCWKSHSGKWLVSGWQPGTLRKRFHRKLPLAFGILAGMAILGGILHPPSNFDALAYRIPRVLHWLAAEQWHWIDTDFNRLNTRTCGIEWVSAPLLLFLKTDRAIFLINAVSFLLMPGLIFSILVRLGVQSRVAWHWMWLLPTGYGYLLQAGSVGNDLFGTIFVLAAFDYALRARQTGSCRDLCLCLLSSAMMTSAKVSNLPLLLPIAILLLPTLKLVRNNLWRVALASLLGLLASMIPTAVLNHVHCGDWKGLAAEPVHFCSNAKLVHLGVNASQILAENLAPTIFPVAKKWNQMVESRVPEDWAATLEAHFESGRNLMLLGEIPTEERAGLGFGISLLVLIAAGGWWRWRRDSKASGTGSRLRGIRWLVFGGGALSLVPFLVQSGISCQARYLLPVYGFLLLPLLATSAQDKVVRTTLWRWACVVVVLLAGVALILSPARPLWPATSILRSAGADESKHRLVQRLWKVYSVYSERSDVFAPVRADLPEDLGVIGFLSFDNPETSLWRPFFHRRVLHVKCAEPLASLQKRGISMVLVSENTLAEHSSLSPQDWIESVDGEVVANYQLPIRASRNNEHWLLVQLPKGPGRLPSEQSDD